MVTALSNKVDISSSHAYPSSMKRPLIDIEPSKTPRNYRGDSKEQRRLQRRTALIGAAKELYGKNGFHSTTVKSICVAAGLTERYFYENFENSESLFIAMHKETSAKIISRLAHSARLERDGAAKIQAMLNTYYGDIADDPVTARLFAVDAGHISPLAREVCLSWRISFGQLLADSVDGVNASPMLRSGVVRGLLGIGVDWMESGFALPQSEVVAAASTIVWSLNPGITLSSIDAFRASETPAQS